MVEFRWFFFEDVSYVKGIMLDIQKNALDLLILILVDALEGCIYLIGGYFVLIEAEEHHEAKIFLTMYLDVVLWVDLELDEAILDDVDCLSVDVQLGGVGAAGNVDVRHQIYL